MRKALGADQVFFLPSWIAITDDGVPIATVDDALADEMPRVHEIASLVAKAKESPAVAVGVYNRPATSFRTAGILSGEEPSGGLRGPLP